MQSSHGSLCSNDSLSFSDADHTEEDADVFLPQDAGGERQPGHTPLPRHDAGVSHLSSWQHHHAFGNGDRSLGGNDPHHVFHSMLVTSTRRASRDKGSPKQTEGGSRFTQKCAELQVFVRPLLDLLNGLKNGRFDRGLNSFQQSVAMDRIQRIVGVLQRPTSGEKHLHTLLQVEMLLKLWFPGIPHHAPAGPRLPSGHNHPPVTPPHKHKDQLHIPVKKRKLSWSDTDSTNSPTLSFRQVKVEEEGRDGHRATAVIGSEQRGGAITGLEDPVGTGKDDKVDTREGQSSGYKVTHVSEPSLTWVHVAPILSPPKSCPSHNSRESKHGNFTVVAVTPPTTRGSPATQDSSISSTTPFSDPCHLSFQLYQPMEFQRELVAAEIVAVGSKAMEIYQGRSKSPRLC
uniref:Circadian associated repressor of transcription n=1 Tax=Paramormyrops kingsleyae TaxID=1676925 RepID=A0A3B3SFN5_9TELE|nr:circadian-associated transcriptional repressor isoform X1 [Paramormyrops kingsleyae]XP_023685775.1 circadian-associated transcriptional repressor isoform X1 [Paramormyrops kingsleyae]